MTNEEFRRSFKVPYHNNLGMAVYSCGVQRCAAGHSWGPAIRDHYLIHYIVSGRGVFSVKGNEYNLSVGDGFLVVPSCVDVYKRQAYTMPNRLEQCGKQDPQCRWKETQTNNS